ncbi:universal stress protein a [Lucifera butyrica]|uniref:Universal stress protein a n=1 Tax=Lucifera butyrica TaxID=1351585 RepID=A0A498R5F9_9FIRM|nr:universal stress protein [Lucifera butyrica]VBB06389.1 universal stress protein a [Lucifera butyrica]
MFSKILVPTDGSKDSLKAVDCARKMAEQFNSSITLLHVIQNYGSMPGFALMAAGAIPPVVLDDLEESGRAILEKTQERLSGFTGKITSRLEFGQASERIVNIAAEEAFSLIIMGSRGLNGFKGLLLGSVSNQVAQFSPCPILIVKGKTTSQPSQS